jgi:UDPglucose--hexose-1-phosphate uridylyltransferase
MSFAKAPCPFCRLVRDEVAETGAPRLRTRRAMCFAPCASRSPFELWVVPRHHAADFGTATRRAARQRADTLPVGPAPARQPGVLRTTSSSSAPLRARVEGPTTGAGDPPAVARDRRLELGTGLPVNPIAPEQVAHELLETAREEESETSVAPVHARGTTSPSAEGQ